MWKNTIEKFLNNWLMSSIDFFLLLSSENRLNQLKLIHVSTTGEVQT